MQNNELDDLTLKLLYYFIVEKSYKPVIIRGVENEIWLEKMNSSLPIIRINSKKIINEDQMEFDYYQTQLILKSIKRKALKFKLQAFNIFTNIEEGIIEENDSNLFIRIETDLDIKEKLNNTFPDIAEKTNFEEKGMDLFVKVNELISKHNKEEENKFKEFFMKKTPLITYGLIAINALMFILMYIFGDGSTSATTLYNFYALEKTAFLNGELIRLVAPMFLHIGILHFLFNNYALYILGTQCEKIFGRTKFLFIYLTAGILSHLATIPFIGAGVVSAGASGAIFGLFGVLLYFSMNNSANIYLGGEAKQRIMSVIFLNLLIGFMVPGINNFAHIGGLISGYLLAMILGSPKEENKTDRVNGLISLIVLTAVIIYVIYFR